MASSQHIQKTVKPIRATRFERKRSEEQKQKDVTKYEQRLTKYTTAE